MNFDLGSLGWKAFQDLCGTILAEVLGQTVQTFSAGRDRGRDAAFTGTWTPQGGEELAGAFAVQCKSIAGGGNFTVSRLRDELAKITRLHSDGLADVYVLMTNGRVSGQTEEAINRAVRRQGPASVLVIGGEQIDRYLAENKRLRALVPRVYGLGDLSEILDERAYAQAQVVLTTMRDSLGRFVVTEPYRRSIDALNRYGFVLLLGEPMAGKSMIAAALAVAAADQWSSGVIKADAPNVFRDHWNPHVPGQFFWVDDAFGTTQYIFSMTDEWNRILPQLHAAISAGTRVVMTSRDYIWNSAKLDLKVREFAPLEEAHVVIDVRELALDDRRQILYNHLKYGNQPRSFRHEVKRFLDAACRVDPFLPEVARRFGDSRFTSRVRADHFSVVRFFQRPLEYLSEVLGSLSNDDRAALALIYMAHGRLASPLALTDHQEAGVRVMGAEPNQMRLSLQSMAGSLVQLVHEAGAGGEPSTRYWSFRHPTILDAVSQRVAGDPELLHVLLVGSPLKELLAEATGGDIALQGALVIPHHHWSLVIQRLEEEHVDDADAAGFLARRCSEPFLREAVESASALVKRLLSKPPSGRVLAARLSAEGLLDERIRTRFVERLTDLAAAGSPSLVTGGTAAAIFTAVELARALSRVREEVVPALIDQVDALEDDWDGGTDPDTHLQTMEEELDALESSFADDVETQRVIDAARGRLEDVRSSLEQQMDPEPDWDDLPYESASATDLSAPEGVFSDVDE